MNAGAALANTLWLARGLGDARRFTRALAQPRAAQHTWLREQLARHAASEFGRTHDFASIRDPGDFIRRIPLTDYGGVEPHLQRIRQGARDVLACGRVTHLAPTSGSTGARKLIPFSASLQRGFGAALGAWMLDLARHRPALIGGGAYWSVSPLAEPDGEDSPSSDAIPMGHADDADYLGGAAAWLVRQTLTVPATLRHVRDMPTFWSLTLLALLRRRDLRLISVWHPSFLDLLVSSVGASWHELLEGLSSGECPWLHALPPAARGGWRSRPDPARAAELRRIGPGDWPRWWPRLQVVSCWGEQAAEAGWHRLRLRLPHVLVQAKGLLATEAVVTIPLGEHRPLAVTSHFFEFLDPQGGVRQSHELVRGEAYELVVTNGGGLWRYRLGDIVECTGHLFATPSLRFLGRVGCVSDLRGEKLSEAFVAEALRGLWPAPARPAYAALQARQSNGIAGYDLMVSMESLSEADADLGIRLESALSANPHYRLARRLGQLAELRVVPVTADHASTELAAHTGRLGDAKPRVLLGVSERQA